MENNEVVIINLDRPRPLRLTNRVLKRFCSGQKVSLADIEQAIQRYDVMVTLLYEMLRIDDPDLTVEHCDDLLDMLPVGEIIETCSRAITAGFGAQDGGDGQDPTSPRRNSAG